MGLIRLETLLFELFFDSIKINSAAFAAPAGAASRLGRKVPIDHPGDVEHRDAENQEYDEVLNHVAKIGFAIHFFNRKALLLVRGARPVPDVSKRH